MVNATFVPCIGIEQSAWAMEELSQKEDVPPMLPLERWTTCTEYHEDSGHEWAPCVEPVLAMHVAVVPVACGDWHGIGSLEMSLAFPVNTSIISDDQSWQHSWENGSTCSSVSAPSATDLDCASLDADLKAGGQARRSALESLRGHVRRLSFEAAGCRVVQLAFEVAEKNVVAELVSELHGHVRKASESPHGNYVIQKIVTTLPIELARFVAEELRGVAVSVARHKFGCRILCRLLEHSASDPWTAVLVEELMVDPLWLSRHNFAHHVLQKVLEHGLLGHKNQIIDAVTLSLWSLVRDRNALFVLETVAAQCDDQRKTTLAAELRRGDVGALIAVSRCHVGMRIIKSVLNLQVVNADTLRGVVQHAPPHFASKRGGDRTWQQLTAHQACMAGA